MEIGFLSMNSIFQFAVKLFYSGVLIGLAYLLVIEVYRMWFDRTLVLASFSYLRDGVDSRESGQSFTRLLGHDLQILEELYTLDEQVSGLVSIPSTDQLGRGRDLNIPIVREDVLPEIEINAYGVQITDFLRRLSRAVRRPKEVAGNVSERNGRFEAYAEIRNSNTTAPHWHLTSRETIDELSRELACRVLLELAAEQEPRLFGRFDSGKPVRAREFCVFMLGLESYQRYRELLTSFEGADRAEDELGRAKQIVEGLIQTGIRFPFSHKLASYVLSDTGDTTNALSEIEAYIATLSRVGHSDESASRLRDSLIAEVRQEQPVETEFVHRNRERPLRPGLSLGSDSGNIAGTLTGVVEDNMGQRYVLTAAHVVADGAGSRVRQPAAYDGGSTDDVIGILSRKLSIGEGTPDDAVAALVAVSEGIEAVNLVPGLGAIGPPVDSHSRLLGANVTVVGRHTMKSARVLEFGSTVQIHMRPGQPTTFRDLIMISPVSEPGDSGAPVVTENNELIGFVFAGSQGRTVVVPIQPILELFGVEWVSS